MNRIKKGDEVVVIAGKDKGRRGTVTGVMDMGKLVVEGVNVARKHVRANPNKGEQGGIVEKEMPLDSSNVMLWNPVTKKGDRVGVKTLESGKRVRFFKSNGEVV
ncbi:MAG: 50S ribosomal protein L24, partial [Gammaproteobacteria bacterium]|nr:50S ribosomal protein L24 [Gammaproteobacteria bacterium]